MAINTAKLLPSSQAGKLAIYQGKGRTNLGMSLGDQSEQVLIVKKQVIKIENLIKRKYIYQLKLQKDEDKRREQRRRNEKEKRLEKAPQEGTGEKLPKVSLPKLGFLDGIKNFIGNMILGFIAFRLIEHLPKLMKVVKFLAPAVDWFIDFSGKVLNALVTFVDWGYKAYDATRGFVKNIFGEDGAAKFDQLSGVLNKFLNLAIIAGMVAAGGGGGAGGGKPGAPGKPGTPYKYDRFGAAVQRNYGHAGRQIYQNARLNGKSHAQALEAVRRAVRQGRIVGAPQTGSLGGTRAGSRILGRGLTRAPQRLATQALIGTLGKGGAKTVLKFVRPFLKRLPIIGALIDFGLSVALGEDPGRAAFRSIGAAILGSVGAAIGSLAFGFGGIVGGILGSIGGDAIGGALYDTFFGNKKSQPNGNAQGRFGGGGVTRGGKAQGGIRREAPTKKDITRTIKVQSSKLDPGSGVGGKEKIKNFYPEVKPGKSNVLDYQENTYKKLSDIPFVGPLLGIAIKAIAGDKPSSVDYTNVGVGLNNWLNTTFNTETMRSGGLAMAGGGEVNSQLFMMGKDMSKIITKSLEESISKKVDDAINDMRKKLGLPPLEDKKKSDPTLETDDSDSGGGMTPGTWGPLLDLIAGKESGGRYEAMYPSTTLPGATKMTIAEVARRATGAVGKYQQLPQYLVGRATAAGLNPNKDLYSPENQEKIIINVNIRGRGGEKWLKGEISDEQFMQGLSQEFASLPNAEGRFYYPGQRSSMTPEKVKAALSKVKKGGYSQQELAAGRDMQLGKGYGAAGEKIAGEVGRFIKQKLRQGPDFQAVTEHPEHGGVRGRHASGSFHYSNRAIDIGAYAHEQGPILRVIEQFNRMKGVKPVELLHARNEPAGHSDHVHVAYAKGGRVRMKTFAMLAEKGQEFVFDADSTASIDRAAPMLLDKLNAASSVQGIVQILKGYGYDDAEEPPTPAPAPPIPPESESMPPQTNFVMLGGAGGGSDSRFDILEKLPG